MSDLLSYSVSDFVSFSMEPYLALYKLYNDAIWPMQVVAAILTVLIFLIVWRGKDLSMAYTRISYAVLAAMWCWIATKFHLERFATINIGAGIYAALFYAQAAFLLITALTAQTMTLVNQTGLLATFGRFIFVFGIAIWPIASVAGSGDVSYLHQFGLAPDPTALATLGIVMLATNRAKYLLSVIPLIWLGLAATTYFVLRTTG